MLSRKGYIVFLKSTFAWIFLILITLFVSSCSTTIERPTDIKESAVSSEQSAMSTQQSERTKEIKQTNQTVRTNQIIPPPTPEFKPAQDEISPLSETISISVTNAALREVIHSVAETVGLNVVMQKGVNPEVPVTVTLKEVSASDALDIILSSTDYFYEIKDNILYIKAMKTKIFEFGHPSINQSYGVDIGGDILGSTSESTSGKIKGNITLSKKSDDKSFNFWDAIEEGLKTIIEHEDTKTAQLKPSFTINRLAGTIVVTGGRAVLERVERYLNKIKEILSRQVIIEARLVEVKLSKGTKYGIDWSFLDDWKGVGTINFGTENFNPTGETGSPIFQLGVTGANFTGLLEALQSQGKVKVLSNPRVNLMNGQTALLSVGRSIDIISKVETTTSTGTTTTGQTTFSIETSNILSGIIIGMVPYINDRGEVSITITPIVSDLVSLEERQIGQVGENNILISLPTIDLREMSTTVKIRDGDMVVLGGLISTKDNISEKEVPFLAKIPILGYLFRRHEETSERKELIILLKPTIVPQT